MKVTLEDQGGVYGYSYPSSPDSDAIINSCETVVKDVAMLYSATVKNPNKADFNQLIVDCLKRRGAVDASYTAERLKSDMQAGTEPFRKNGEITPAAQECLTNPSRG